MMLQIFQFHIQTSFSQVLISFKRLCKKTRWNRKFGNLQQATQYHNFSSCKPGLFWWGFFQFSKEIGKNNIENSRNYIRATQIDCFVPFNCKCNHVKKCYFSYIYFFHIYFCQYNISAVTFFCGIAVRQESNRFQCWKYFNVEMEHKGRTFMKKNDLALLSFTIILNDGLFWLPRYSAK